MGAQLTGAAVPPEVEHTLVWTRLPIFHPDLVAERVSARIAQDGIWGFTGETSPPPSPSTLPLSLPSLAEWGVTMSSLVRSSKGTEEEEEMVRQAGREVDAFVRNRWPEQEWETAWFVNPPVGVLLCGAGYTTQLLPRWNLLAVDPTCLSAFALQRLQSVPGLAHFHVFARRK